MRDQFLIQNDHPIIASHTVLGRSVLPGVAYIDLLFQAFREAGHEFDTLELRNLSIHRPLVVTPEAPVLLTLDWVDRGGLWQIRLNGEAQTPGHEAAGGMLLATAEMAGVGRVGFAEQLDLAAVSRGASAPVELEQLYAICRQRGLVHSGFIKGAGRVTDAGDSLIVEVSLPAAALASAGDYLFHPTLMDACAIGAGLLLGQEDGGALFLPISYESFRATHVFPPHCLARISKASVRPGSEMVKLSIEYFDETGKKIGELKNSAVKRARTATEAGAHPGSANPGGGNRVSGNVSGDPSDDAAKRFLRELFARQLGKSGNDLPPGAGYYDLGLDSAGLLELTNRIGEKTGQSPSPTLLFEYTTIEALAGYLASAFPNLFPSRAGELAGAGLPPEAGLAPRPTEAPDQSLSTAVPPARAEVAIIGLAGRYPGAGDMVTFWENLKSGKDCVGEIPASRWDWREFEDLRTPSGKKISKWGGFVADADCFDAGFFRVSPAEAELMDPQERLFLETCWSAIEDAGYTPETLAPARGANKRRRVGVFAGAMHKDYMLLGAEAVAAGARVPVSLNHAQIANRVSYCCDFHGPSLVVDTVCSSSLTAVHLALESILHGESDVALAGGVNLALHPEKYLTYGMLDMHSSDGRCRSFGEGGDGYVAAEGVGAVVLKPLRQAVADGDQIYAVIKASVVNHGGAVSGMTVPSPVGQAEMISECLEKAGTHPRTISYLEAHGTGTSLGDPIELLGLSKAFGGAAPAEKTYCAIGSVKSNIGHAESAAGISGLSKVALQLRHGILVPSLHAEPVNHFIDFPNSPFYLQRVTAEWPRPVVQVGGREEICPRRAGVSSFGATGSNAHLILEEYVPPPGQSRPGPGGGPQLVPLSAKSEDRLRASALNLLEHLRRRVPSGDARIEAADLADLAFTLQIGRMAFAHRVVFIVEDIPALVRALEQFVNGAVDEDGNNCYVGNPKSRDKTGAMIGADEDGRAMIASWISKRKLARVAELWAGGLDFDWTRLHGGIKPSRVSLPTYPFARERYWLPKISRKPSLPSIAPASERAVKEESAVLMLEPQWRELAIEPATVPASFGERWIFFCEHRRAWPDFGDRRADGVHCEVLKAGTGSIDEAFQAAALTAFKRIQGILQAVPKAPVLVQIVVPLADDDSFPENQVFLGLSGLLRSARLENSRLAGQVIAVDPGTPVRELWALLDADGHHPQHREVRHVAAERAVLGWRELEFSPSAAPLPWRSDGTYLITGGAGGLGLLFAEEIARRSPDSKIVLTGRSELGPERLASLEDLRARGTRIEYRRGDMRNLGVVTALMEELRASPYNLKGIIHSAGVLRDNLIVNKSETDLLDVLAPKVTSTVILDEVTKGIALDFLVLFSSGAGSMGNLGQADYSMANGFMDAFAQRRQSLVGRKERFGQSLSLAWPLWKDGGMRVGTDTAELMEQVMGMVPMRSENGIRAFYQALQSGRSRVLVMEGIRDRLKQFWKGGASPAQRKDQAGNGKEHEINQTGLAERVLGRMKHLLSEVTKHDPSLIDADEPLESYGIDSIVITRLNNLLSGPFDQLSKTLFYEHKTLGAIATQLLKERPQECDRWCRGDANPEMITPVEPARPEPIAMERPEGGTSMGTEPEPIAIIGMSGRFPGGDDLEAFWGNLKAGKDCMAEIPEDRWPMDGFFEPDAEKAAREGKSYSKWGALLESFADFDAGFFNISPREAMAIDPQERLFLQECWRALEDAGYPPAKMKDDVRARFGVYCGVTRSGFAGWSDSKPGFICNTSFASIVNRVSYSLDLRGPSVPVDAMCSSALVAVHQACEALRQGGLAMALVGAVNLYTHPLSYRALSQNKLLSASPVARVFAEGGEGFVPGEGVGVVVLKRLAEARRDGNAVLAVISGSAVNHGGKTNGYAIPNPNQQAAVIQTALRAAGLDSRAIGYLECAASGSEMGDAIEMSALARVFGRSGTGAEKKLPIGSIKSHFGHGESVSGMAQLIKVVLQLRHKTLCPTRVVGNPNPGIDFKTLPFEVQTSPGDWGVGGDESSRAIRRAGINSFGAGGVNAHVIVEEYPAEPESVDPNVPPRPSLFVLSAKTEPALRRYAADWSRYLKMHPDLDLRAVAWRLQTGRDEMKHRLAGIANDRGTLRQCLDCVANGETHPLLFQGVAGGNRGPASGHSDQAPANGWSLEQTAAAWVSGKTILWESLYDKVPSGRPAQLPTYPFEKKRFWFGSEQFPKPQITRAMGGGPTPFYIEPATNGSGLGARFVPFEDLALPGTWDDGVASRNGFFDGASDLEGDRKMISAGIETVLKEILYYEADDRLDPTANFEELGLNSVLVAPFVQRLAAEFAVELRETIIFDHTTIEKLGDYITARREEAHI